ncbi:helix-turn-helix transcriptional regulator [Vibrio sp. SM6]|uniref:Helix-turn-helix transcriptional regulator n=1 Tax=Vibrio agarilyticus TaxID=2726741 RepID=A0A7X8TR03_9VIBR|nr:metalloregulator ArsR/SmtB family transcription factor [Vibrio agarilyticus]NLS13392.1 helix-turn-helix transcriptional regulator [Vibrio agarilyticus]
MKEPSNVNDPKQMQQLAAQAANWLKVMAHPDRLLVLCQLIDGEISVGALMQLSTLSQSAFSQHLSVLRQNQLVTTRKEAQQVYYRLADERVKKLIELLHNEFCQGRNEEQ